MAAASYTTNLVDITTAEGTTGFTGIGGGGAIAYQETDFYIQGNFCLSKATNNTWDSAGTPRGGDRFNTAGVKAALVERKPMPDPEPAAPVAHTMIDMAPVALAQEKMGAMLAHAIASLPQPQSAVREWLFTVERDKDGLLTSIRATASN